MKIIDEFTDRDDLSRAMKYVLRKRRDGKCRVGGCPNEVVESKSLCRIHLIARYEKWKAKTIGSRRNKCATQSLMEETTEG